MDRPHRPQPPTGADARIRTGDLPLTRRWVLAPNLAKFAGRVARLIPTPRTTNAITSVASFPGTKHSKARANVAVIEGRAHV